MIPEEGRAEKVARATKASGDSICYADFSWTAPLFRKSTECCNACNAVTTTSCGISKKWRCPIRTIAERPIGRSEGRHEELRPGSAGANAGSEEKRAVGDAESGTTSCFIAPKHQSHAMGGKQVGQDIPVGDLPIGSIGRASSPPLRIGGDDRDVSLHHDRLALRLCSQIGAEPGQLAPFHRAVNGLPVVAAGNRPVPVEHDAVNSGPIERVVRGPEEPVESSRGFLWSSIIS